MVNDLIRKEDEDQDNFIKIVVQGILELVVENIQINFENLIIGKKMRKEHLTKFLEYSSNIFNAYNSYGINS